MTYSNSPIAQVAGLLDPAGMSIGFMIPVFFAEFENARLIQRIGPDGMVDRFEVAEDQDTRLLPAEARTVSVGEAAVLAFSLDGVTVVAAAERLREHLAKLLDDGILRSRPVLGLEVATFVGRTGHEDEYAALAFRRLSDLTSDGALDWRDISVLTPMVRRTLLLSLGSRGSAWLDDLYVSLEDRTASVVGMAGANDRELALVGQAIEAAAARMPSIFDRPKQGWRVRVTREDEDRPSPDLSLVVVGARLRHLLDRAVDGKALRVGLQELGGVDNRSQPPAAIVFEARDRESEYQARRASSSRNIMLIAVGTSRGGIADHGPTMLGEFPHGRIDLPNTGTYQAAGPQPTDAVAVRLAAAIVAELTQGLYEAPHPRSALIRAAGALDDPMVLATLYGRAWALGLAPWKSIYVVDRNRVPKSFRYEEVRRSLFDEVPIVGGKLVERALVGSRASGALLVSSNATDEEDLRRHARSAAMLLKVQGWETDVAEDLGELGGSDALEVRVRGARSSFLVRVGAPDSIKSSDAALDHRTMFPSVDLQGIETLRLVPSSSSRTMLNLIMERGELAVEMRDLVHLEPTTGNVWSLLASHLRRTASPPPTPPPPHNLGMIAKAALYRSDPQTLPRDDRIFELLHEIHLGDRLQLVLRRCRWQKGNLTGTLSLVQTDGGPRRMVNDEPLDSWIMEIDEQGPRLRR